MDSTFDQSTGYKHLASKHHLVLDLPYWEELHKNSTNLDRSVDAWFYHPLDFITYSKLREELVPQVQHEGIPVPTDLVFWTVDEPFRPYLTRTGGAPFRAADKPWPMRHGNPCTFLAQFCFRDSLDLFPELPGDLLLIFVTDLSLIYDGGPNNPDTGLHLEWVTIEEVTEVVSAVECPANFKVPRYSGVLHRYFDYAFDTFDRNLIKLQFPECTYWYNYVNIAVTKIGSTYIEVQRGWDPRQWVEEDSSLAGHWFPLGSFHTLSPCRRSGKHFIDDPSAERIVHRQDQNDASLRFSGDPGHLVLFSARDSDSACAYLVPG